MLSIHYHHHLFDFFSFVVHPAKPNVHLMRLSGVERYLQETRTLPLNVQKREWHCKFYTFEWHSCSSPSSVST